MIDYTYKMPGVSILPDTMAVGSVPDIHYDSIKVSENGIVTTPDGTYDIVTWPDQLDPKRCMKAVMVDDFSKHMFTKDNIGKIHDAVQAGMKIGVCGAMGPRLMTILAKAGVSFFILGYMERGPLSSDLSDAIYNFSIQDVLHQWVFQYGNQAPVYVPRVKTVSDMIVTYITHAAGAIFEVTDRFNVVDSRKPVIKNFFMNMGGRNDIFY